MERELNEMERGISKLPQEMKELVFAKLPFESVFCSRIVCKEWNSILSSNCFLSSLAIQNPWLLICCRKDGKWHCMAYSFSAQKWMALPLSFPPDLVRKRGYPSGAGQGLLLYEETPTQRSFVFNPIMRSYAEIEMDLTDKYIHFAQGRKKEPYLVVWSNSGDFSIQICHYFQDAWRNTSQFADNIGANILRHNMVECNDVLFWRGKSRLTIVGYKIKDEGFISPVTVAPLPSQLVNDLDGCNFFMFSYGSSVLVVGSLSGLYLGELNIPEMGGAHPLFEGIEPSRLQPNNTGIVIWELFQDEGDELLWNWKEFARMPPESLPECFDPASREKCVCVGDYLCFSSLVEAESVTVFAYNLREGFWQRLPPCKIHINKRFWMPFEPKLNHYQFLGKSGERGIMLSR